MIHYGRALLRLSCLQPVLPRFAVLPSCSLASKTALLCERPDECEQRSEPPDRTAEVVDSFIRLSECRRTADDMPDLSQVKTRLGEHLTALSFQQLGKWHLFIAIAQIKHALPLHPEFKMFSTYVYGLDTRLGSIE
jgi:hypothetical protein